MNHFIELIFENTPKIIKNNGDKECWYSDILISIRFNFECKFYYDAFIKCQKILNDNKIPYLKN